MHGTQGDRAGFFFTFGGTQFRGFNAMVHAVSHDVHQGIPNAFKQRSVQFGFRTQLYQLHFFAAHLRGVTHQTRKLRPHIADGLHTRFHHAGLQAQRHHVNGSHRARKVGITTVRGK